MLARRFDELFLLTVFDHMTHYPLTDSITYRSANDFTSLIVPPCTCIRCLSYPAKPALALLTIPFARNFPRHYPRRDTSQVSTSSTSIILFRIARRTSFRNHGRNRGNGFFSTLQDWDEAYRSMTCQRREATMHGALSSYLREGGKTNAW